VVEQLTQNCKIEGSNPANDPGNWKGLDLVTYKKKRSSLAQWLNNRHKIISSGVQILPITIVQKTMAKETYEIILLCFVSTVVEQSTQNHKIEGSNPANDPGNWKGLDLVTYKKKIGLLQHSG
jgi:hypothetical protein